MAKMCAKKIGLTKFHSTTTVFGKLLFEHCCSCPFKCDINTFKAISIYFFFFFNDSSMLQCTAKLLSVAHFAFVFTNGNNSYDKNAENNGTDGKPCYSSTLQYSFDKLIKLIY